MPNRIGAAIKRIGLTLGGIVAVLGSVSGVIATIQWAAEAFGVTAVVVAGAFAAGAVMMHGIDHARAVRPRVMPPGRPGGSDDTHVGPRWPPRGAINRNAR